MREHPGGEEAGNKGKWGGPGTGFCLHLCQMTQLANIKWGAWVFSLKVDGLNVVCGRSLHALEVGGPPQHLDFFGPTSKQPRIGQWWEGEKVQRSFLQSGTTLGKGNMIPIRALGKGILRAPIKVAPV